jgi:hypothetical protein
VVRSTRPHDLCPRSQIFAGRRSGNICGTMRHPVWLVRDQPGKFSGSDDSYDRVRNTTCTVALIVLSSGMTGVAALGSIAAER